MIRVCFHYKLLSLDVLIKFIITLESNYENLTNYKEDDTCILMVIKNHILIFI